MRLIAILVVAGGFILLGQYMVLAQTIQEQEPASMYVIGENTAVRLGLVLTVGVLLASVGGSWLMLKLQLSNLHGAIETRKAMCTERTSSIFSTLKRHEQELRDLERERRN